MKTKYYSQYLLRALDGEDLRLDDDLRKLVDLSDRVSMVVPVVPSLDDDARRRIWNGAISGVTEPIKLERRGGRIPRLAWVGAAGLALAVIAVLVIVFLTIGGPAVREPIEIASLRLEQGEMIIRAANGEERTARDGEALGEGDVILASAGARGIVEFESGSLLRLYGEAEIGLSAGEGGVMAEIFKGKTYHRVIGGMPYTARSGDVEVTATGTAFTFDVEEKAGEIISVQSSVQVDVEAEFDEELSSYLEEGEVFLYGEGLESSIQEVTREDLDDEWLRWNKAQDEALGLPLGVLSMLDEEIAGQEQGAQPEEQETTTPADEPVQPTPQPTPQPPAPTPTPVEKSLVLAASARDGAVDFSWTLAGYSGFQGFKLCRSESNKAPSYPGDWWMYIDGANTRAATDTSVQAGHTYYYRLAVYNQGDILGYSNAVAVTVPGQPQEFSISLSGVAEASKIKLSWSVSGEGSYDGFKVCRSETNPSPSYPGDTCTFVSYGQDYFNDTSVVSGKTYYYRVGIYKDGAVIKYSNAVTVTVP